MPNKPTLLAGLAAYLLLSFLPLVLRLGHLRLPTWLLALAFCWGPVLFSLLFWLLLGLLSKFRRRAAP